MLELHTFPTPNGHKVHILLEELGLPYEVRVVDITRGDQFDPAFLAISPNNKMPVLVDSDGPDGAPVAVFESGAILMYLAEKAGRFLPTEPRARYEVIMWLMFQMGTVGPMLGQNHHFRKYAPEPIPYAIERYTNEARRIYRVLDRRLRGREFLVRDYTIADMAVFPWIRPHRMQGITLSDYPDLHRWFSAMRIRPAVERGLGVLREYRGRTITLDATAHENLFGARQYDD